MSGSNVWKLRLTTEGADQVVRDLREASTASAAAARAYETLIKAQPQLASGAERSEQALRKNVDAMRSMRGEYGQGSLAIDAATASMGRFGSALTSPVAAIAALSAGMGAGVVQIARLGDEFTNTMNKLTAATGSAGAATRVYAELAAMSQQTGASISESAGAFVRFSVAARAIGATNGEVLTLTRTIQQAGLISGASTQEAASGVQQLGQALASGTLQGDELRSILENMPVLAEALAGQLGVSIGQLRQMGSEGQLTSDRVFQALLRAGVQINEQFNQLTPTMGRAFGILGQSMVDFVGKLDQALGLSQGIARAAMAAAAGVRAVGNLGAARSPGEQAQLDLSNADGRRANISAEIARLESDVAPTARRGSLRPAMQEAAAQTTGRDARLAELRASLQEEIRLTEAAQLRIITVESESDRTQFAEQQTANDRRLAVQRTAATTAFNTVQTALDKERTARAEHGTRIAAIDAGLAIGSTDAAGAARLRGLADADLAKALEVRTASTDGATRADRSGAGASRDAAAAARELADAARTHDAVMRDGEGVTRSVRNELEKYADEVARLDRLLSAGAITQDIYSRAVAAADPAIRAATESARQIEQQNTRMTDSITSFFGNSFARAFEGTGDGFRGLMQSFRRAAISTFATIASQAIIRPIIAPIVQGLGLGGLTGGAGGGLNLGGLFGGGTAQAATQGAASGSGGGIGLGTVSSGLGIGRQVMGMFQPGGLGSFFPGGNAANTGFGFLDGALNTTLVAQSANAGINATGAAVNAGGFGSMAANSIDMAGSAVNAGVGSGLTVMGALGPAAAIAGGAYGIYSGIQRGGIGGGVGALGGAVTTATGLGMLGAAAGLLPALGALGPIGLALGAALALASAFLPGQKASGKGQLSRVNLESREESFEGLGGKRFSQGNRDQASAGTDRITDLVDAISKQLGGAQIGGNVAVGVTSARDKKGPGSLYLEIGSQKERFTNDEAGMKSMGEVAARMIINEFKGQNTAQGDFQSILQNSPSDLASLSANLDWFETVYKGLTKSAEAASAYSQQLTAATKPYDDAIAKARQLGLAEDALTRARDKATQKLEEARAATLVMADLTLQQREIAVGIGGGDLFGAAQRVAEMQATMAARDELEKFEQAMKDAGASTAEVTTLVGRLATVQAAEVEARKRVLAEEAEARKRALAEETRLRLRENFTTARDAYTSALSSEISTREQSLSAMRQNTDALRNVAEGLRSYVAGLKLDASLSPLTMQQRLDEARAQYDAAYAGSQVGTIEERAKAAGQLSGLGNTRLGLASNFFAPGTEAYVKEFNQVTGGLDALANQFGMAATVEEMSLKVQESSLTVMQDQLTAAREAGETAKQTLDVLRQAFLRAAGEAGVPVNLTSGGIGSLLNPLSNQHIPMGDFGEQLRGERIFGGRVGSGENLTAGSVNALYRQFLGRDAEAGVAEQWMAGGGRGFDLAGALEQSAEFQSRLTQVRGFAVGGYASPGFAMVGERGPELVDFATPGRVYTADQTRAAMRGDDGLLAEVQALREMVKQLCTVTAQGSMAVKGAVDGQTEVLVDATAPRMPVPA